MANLQAWMQQYAERFRQPNLASSSPVPGAAPQNLTAPQTAAAPAAAPAMGAPAPQMQPQAPAAGAAATPEIPGDGFGAEGDDSFEAHFKKQPEDEQEKQVSELEKKVGDIDRAYAQMSQQLGQRPSTKLTRREKGMHIMEFGLQLMSQSSGSQHGGDIGGAIGDAGLATMKSVRADQDGKEKDARQWDRDQVNLRSSRTKEVQGVEKEHRQGLLDERRSAADERRAAAAERAAANGERRLDQTDAQIANLESWRDTQVERGIGAGRRTTPAGTKPTAAIQNIEYLVKNGIPRETATRIVHKQVKDPRKAFEEIYKSSRSRFASEDDAKAEATRIVETIYGEGSIDQAQAPLATPSEDSGSGSYEDQLKAWADEPGISATEKQRRQQHMNRELYPGVAR